MAAMAGGLGTLLYAGAARLDFFRVGDGVEVEGNQRITRAEVLMMSGVDVRTNIIAFDTIQAAAAIEKHPWVSRARVYRDLPNRLRIKIEERKPIALLSRDDGLYYVDRAGAVFAQAGGGDDLDYPLITGIKNEGRAAAGLLDRALAMISTIRRNDPIFPRQSLSELHVDRDGEQTLYLVNTPFPLRLGHSRPRQGDIAAVLKQLYRRKVIGITRSVDMEYGRDRVLVRLKTPLV